MKIFLAGHRGFVGSAILKKLKQKGYKKIKLYRNAKFIIDSKKLRGVFRC